MRACGRILESGERCGELYEGPDGYCKRCRNDYQREYYQQRKKKGTTDIVRDLGLHCVVCAVGLRASSIFNYADRAFCGPCHGVVRYFAEAAQEVRDIIIETVDA